jgi:integrase
MLDGQRRTKLFDTKKEARAWEAAERKRLKSGEPTQTPDGMELITFCNLYLDYAKQRFVKKTYLEKRALVQRICDKWGKHTPVDEISAGMIATYLGRQAKERSNNASNKDRKNLLSMWNWGVKMHDLQHNPVAKISRFPHDRQKQYTPPEKDVLKVLAVATREERVFLDCYLHTAARRSEIFRWVWNGDVSLEKREVRLGTRKTKDGSMEYEWLPMNDDLYKSLMWLRRNRQFPESPCVFVDAHPGPHYGEPFKVRRRFLVGLCERAKVRPFGFHALRRYVASILADKHKVSAKTIQRILRHKNLGTTEKYLENIHHDLRDTMALLSQKEENILHETLHEKEKRS